MASRLTPALFLRVGLILVTLSLFWLPQCRDGEKERLLLENQKRQRELAKIEKEKEQLQEDLQKKSDEIDDLSGFLRDILCDPFGSEKMQEYLQKNPESYLGGLDSVLRRLCAPGSGNVPRLRPDKGDKLPEIIKKVAPNPEWLRVARIQGVVILEVEIDEAGNVRCPCVISGHPLLNAYAWEAVLHWKYKPYFINGKPSPVGFIVSVRFSYDQIQ